MPQPRFLAACAQMTSRDDLSENLATSARLVAESARRGAQLVLLPENFAFLGKGERDKFAHAERLADGGPIMTALTQMARDHGVWVLAGGMPEKAEDPGRVYNTLVAVSPDGEIRASYRKIHLFDIDIPGGVTLKESDTVAPGSDAVVLETPFAPVGLSICYDVRFPELYRRLVERGARVLVVPAAFTSHTGKDHWHALLRARAVENECYVLAAAQIGQHNDRRRSYGHSLIVDPWGTVLAEAPDTEGIVVAEINPEYQDWIRRSLPCLDHRRL